MIRLRVKVVPGARHSRIVGRLGDALKVQLVAPPERGKANAALVALLSQKLGVKPAQVTIVSGHAGPLKVVQFEGVSTDMIDGVIGG